jgi:hypothetical protein
VLALQLAQQCFFFACHSAVSFDCRAAPRVVYFH